MFFNKIARYKNNYLAKSLSATIGNIYTRKEFDIYNTLKEIADEKGKVTDEDVWKVIAEFRYDVAKAVFGALEREYKAAGDMANNIYAELYKDNYEDMQKKGISISCAYITAARCVLGEDCNGVNINEIAAPLINEFEKMEEHCIKDSLEILKEDGIIETVEIF